MAVLTALTPLLGGYMARVYMGRRVVLERVLGPVERGFYRAVGTDPAREQDWKQYGRTVLLLKIWGPKYVDETHYLRQYMAQLPRKLEPDPARPRHLLTELGMGCRYQP